MRVLQVVTLISPDGAYGGPTRVAFNQASALMESGVEVDVCAGTLGIRRCSAMGVVRRTGAFVRRPSSDPAHGVRRTHLAGAGIVVHTIRTTL